ncbi:hypothetical protein AK812_SmicGene6135 [Symbiodinium microadriaticum]|uniref:Uncharacterized protein n=1 Tax=Symbiodinium microadriaticum TaxID=2951 RepID=A0A1Q9ES35_SYMMI|nr:hypothetical protein AK812_SmicGene6135 [Symbiodinium microadriaticum]
MPSKVKVQICPQFWASSELLPTAGGVDWCDKHSAALPPKQRFDFAKPADGDTLCTSTNVAGTAPHGATPQETQNQRHGSLTPEYLRTEKYTVEEPWSALRFLARLSPGLCLSNLFVLHFAGAYVLDEPIELSVFVCCAYLLMTFLLSLLVSLLPLFLVEGPAACLLSNGLPQDMPVLPAAAAAA